MALTLDRVMLEIDGFTVAADFEVPDGGVVAVIGPSGAGKSTLLSAIAGFLAPTSGRVLWDGADITTLAPGRRPVAMLFQDNNLFPHLTLWQNVALGLSPSLRLSPADRTLVDEALAQVGLAGMGDRKPAQVSGGQQSRAALARVLVMDRPLVLLDEPFAALGPALKAEMLDLVRAALSARGATALMVSHDPDDAKGYAERTIFVAEGIAQAPQPTEALFAVPPPALKDYLGT